MMPKRQGMECVRSIDVGPRRGEKVQARRKDREKCGGTIAIDLRGAKGNRECGATKACRPLSNAWKRHVHRRSELLVSPARNRI